MSSHILNPFLILRMVWQKSLNFDCVETKVVILPLSLEIYTI